MPVIKTLSRPIEQTPPDFTIDIISAICFKKGPGKHFKKEGSYY